MTAKPCQFFFAIINFIKFALIFMWQIVGSSKLRVSFSVSSIFPLALLLLLADDPGLQIWLSICRLFWVFQA